MCFFLSKMAKIMILKYFYKTHNTSTIYLITYDDNIYGLYSDTKRERKINTNIQFQKACYFFNLIV